MYYTPKNVIDYIDPSAGTGGYMLHIATGHGKSRDFLDLIENPPHAGIDECMTDLWSESRVREANERAIRLRNAIAKAHNYLVEHHDGTPAVEAAIEIMEDGVR